MSNECMVEDLGKVYLVGSGPGAAAYLTLQAQEVLAQAQVLVYDALVDGDLIDLVPDTCLKLDVGKRGGQPSTPQSEINRLLVEHCQQGKIVVRLKNGDPFVFGRAQSEIGALKKYNCEFEIIPGLSSALVAPLMAGIPLTDPQLSQSFTVITAHNPDSLNWVSLTKLDTLVFLMGGRTLPEIVRRLRGHGRSPATPIAIIRYAGRPNQQIWDGTLNTILDKTAGISLSPCVIVVGEVVKLRTYVGEQGRRQKVEEAEIKREAEEEGRKASVFASVSQGARIRRQETTGRQPQFEEQNPTYPTDSSDPLGPHAPTSSVPEPPTHTGSEPLPLDEKTILVTRAASQSTQFMDLLEAQGARVVEMPTLEIGPPSSWRDLDRAIERIDDFDWLILTSTNGVDYFFQRLEKVTGERAFYSNIKIAVVGEKTAQRLIKIGIQPDFVPPNFVADALVAHFPEPLAGLRVLFPRVESGGRELLVKEFTNQGAKVREVAAYESRCPDTIAPAALKALRSGKVDVVTFASSKTVQHFCQLLQQVDDNWPGWLEKAAVASIGPQTSKACKELLGRVDVEAQEYTLDGLTDAIVAWAKPKPEPEPKLDNLTDSAPPVLPVNATPESELREGADSQEAIEPQADSATFPVEGVHSFEALGAESGAEILSAVSTLDLNSQSSDADTSTQASVLDVLENSSLDGVEDLASNQLIEVELVLDSDDTTQFETLQVELDSPTPNSAESELLAAEVELIAEIQAVIEQGELDQPNS